MEKTITIAICDDEKAIRDEISECIRDIVSDATIKCYDNALCILDSDFDAEEFYKSYEEIRKLCSLQLSEFEMRWNVGYLANQEQKESLPREAYARTGEINDKFMELNAKIREYLDNLDVLDV